MTWDGEEYQGRFDALAATGFDVHGEADFVGRLAPRSVLDAGCGSGRVAAELARRGVDVVGVDVDTSMIATARQHHPNLEWHVHDLSTLALGRAFDVVVMAGNVLLFTPPDSHRAVVAGCARHLAPNGVMITGFQLGSGYDLARFDADCEAAGLVWSQRWATWAGAEFPGDGSYAVSLHRRAPTSA